MKFRIREARERAGYSQKELAEIIGVAQNTFHGYESGKHDPKSELLSKIATACNVTVDFLLGRDTEHPSVIQVDFGHGEMDAKKAPPLSGEAMRLAKDYDSLDRWGRQALRELAETELQRMEADMGEDAFGALWAEFEHARKVRYKELCKRWGSKDYQGIVDYMDTPVDGPEEEPVGHE